MTAQMPQPFYSGKVRDLYPADDSSMIIASTDRISAFDVVLPKPLAGKGQILNHISLLWFEKLRQSGLHEKLGFTDHLLASELKDYPAPYNELDYFAGRSMLVKRTQRIDFECVVRGYLVGSGWKDYQKTGAVCGHALPENLKLATKLPQPIFTPATKAPEGEHDENITVAEMKKRAGEELTNRLENISIELYNYAAALMEPAGIILCDTKFEFGMIDNRLVLIDEVLTPDSSRYWSVADYKIGENPPSYDKQIVRDYLEELNWNKTPPAPELPEEITSQAMQRYREIEQKIAQALK